MYLQGIKWNLKRTVDFISQVKDLTPEVKFPTLQQLTIDKIIQHHTQDLLETRENVDTTINLVLCQALYCDPHTPECKVHALYAEHGWERYVHDIYYPRVLQILAY